MRLFCLVCLEGRNTPCGEYDPLSVHPISTGESKIGRLGGLGWKIINPDQPLQASQPDSEKILKLSEELFRTLGVLHYNQGSYQNLTLVTLAYANACYCT